MPRIVMKFGGTSMAGIERIRHVADRVKREVAQGNEVAVVVSAMAGETDRLVQLCKEAAPLYDPREYDVVVASGEQVTSGLLAMTLQGMGVNARVLHGLAAADPGQRPQLGLIDAYRFRHSRTGVPARRHRRHPRLPGRDRGRRRRDARPRRVRHLGRRARGRGQGRPLRHLHRRRGRLHDRPAHRPTGAQAERRHLRGNAGAGRRSAPRCCRPARSASPCATTCRCRCCPRSRTSPERDRRRRQDRGVQHGTRCSSPGSRTTRTRP